MQQTHNRMSATTTAIDLKNHPLVKELAAHQERLGLSNKAFARRYLGISDPSWVTIKLGKQDSNVDFVVAEGGTHLTITSEVLERGLGAAPPERSDIISDRPPPAGWRGS